MAFYVDALVNSGSHTAVGGDATTSTPQVPVVFEFDLASGETAHSKVVPYPVQVIYAFALKSGSNGGAGDAVSLKRGADLVAQADLHVDAGKTVIAEVDPTKLYFAEGSVMTASGTLATDDACRFYVSALVR